MSDAWQPNYGLHARGRRRAQNLAERVTPLLPVGETLELAAECLVDSGRLEAASSLPGMVGAVPMLLAFFRRRIVWLGDTHLGLLSRKRRHDLLVARNSIVVEEFSYLAPARLVIRTPEGRFRFSFMGPWLQHAKELNDRLARSPDAPKMN